VTGLSDSAPISAKVIFKSTFGLYRECFSRRNGDVPTVTPLQAR
jgi:hypothetical protein